MVVDRNGRVGVAGIRGAGRHVVERLVSGAAVLERWVNNGSGKERRGVGGRLVGGEIEAIKSITGGVEEHV